MADFVTGSFAFYLVSGGTYTLNTLIVNPRDTNDFLRESTSDGSGNDNDTFEVGEDINDSFGVSNPGTEGTYIGCFASGGDLFFIVDFGEFYAPGQPQVRVYASQDLPDVTFPATFGTGTTLPIDTSNHLFCFAAGTGIATPGGTRRVEALETGDEVTTSDGRTVPVKWIGRQTVHKLFSGPHMQPVRIRAGALGHGLPEADLTVTADHGMILDGLVINASALVNGTTIDFVPLDELPERVTYYHVETEDHDVILANGSEAETFIDAAGRKAFDNYQEYLDRFGTERVIPEMRMPRIASPRLLPDSIRARVGVRTGSAGFGLADIA